MDKIIKRPNSLIEARYYLSSKQNDIIDLVLSRIKNDDNKLEYEITLSDYTELFEIGVTNIYSDFKKAVKEFGKNASFFLYDYKGEEEQEFFWFVKIIYKNKEGKIIFKIDEEVKDILLQIKNITFYDIKYPLNMTSIYSKRFYYYLKRFQDTGIRIDKIDNLLIKLNCPSSYKKYSFFKIKVLKMAEKEINGNTDISFTYEEIKSGRKIESLKFYIHSNKETNKKITLNDVEISQNVDLDLDDLIDELREFITEPIKTKDLKTILKEANNNVALIKSKYEISKQQSKIDNLVAWLIAAIKEDYSEPIPSQGKKDKPSKFINYEQSEWDFNNLEELERQLVDNLSENNMR